MDYVEERGDGTEHKEAEDDAAGLLFNKDRQRQGENENRRVM